jgi:hypothetical protein
LYQASADFEQLGHAIAHTIFIIYAFAALVRLLPIMFAVPLTNVVFYTQKRK